MKTFAQFDGQEWFEISSDDYEGGGSNKAKAVLLYVVDEEYCGGCGVFQTGCDYLGEADDFQHDDNDGVTPNPCGDYDVASYATGWFEFFIDKVTDGSEDNPECYAIFKPFSACQA